MSVPSLMTGLSQDDDLVPWLNPHHQSLDGYCSDFLHDVSPVAVDEQESEDAFPLFQRRDNGNESAPLLILLHYSSTVSNHILCMEAVELEILLLANQQNRIHQLVTSLV